MMIEMEDVLKGLGVQEDKIHLVWIITLNDIIIVQLIILLTYSNYVLFNIGLIFVWNKNGI